MSTIKGKAEVVTVEAWVEIEPELTHVGSVEGPKMVYALGLTWRWLYGKWESFDFTLYYHRVKKDGSLYAKEQSIIVYGNSSRAQFADALNGTRPAWEPGPAPEVRSD